MGGIKVIGISSEELLSLPPTYNGIVPRYRSPSTTNREEIGREVEILIRGIRSVQQRLLRITDDIGNLHFLWDADRSKVMRLTREILIETSSSCRGILLLSTQD